MGQKHENDLFSEYADTTGDAISRIFDSNYEPVGDTTYDGEFGQTKTPSSRGELRVDSGNFGKSTSLEREDILEERGVDLGSFGEPAKVESGAEL